ncbi:MAG: hypothetical protein E6I97_12300 [Chloroflexi bacterium]|nr:MAG: hypothetical protein E6I97_12300 [Chloroflexota bacterium]
MFLGEHEHTIDAKGRMAVPAKFRAQMDRGGVISKGMGVCLSVYTMQGWEEKSAELVSGKSVMNCATLSGAFILVPAR